MFRREGSFGFHFSLNFEWKLSPPASTSACLYLISTWMIISLPQTGINIKVIRQDSYQPPSKMDKNKYLQSILI